MYKRHANKQQEKSRSDYVECAEPLCPFVSCKPCTKNKAFSCYWHDFLLRSRNKRKLLREPDAILDNNGHFTNNVTIYSNTNINNATFNNKPRRGRAKSNVDGGESKQATIQSPQKPKTLETPLPELPPHQLDPLTKETAINKLIEAGSALVNGNAIDAFNLGNDPIFQVMANVPETPDENSGSTFFDPFPADLLAEDDLFATLRYDK